MTFVERELNFMKSLYCNDICRTGTDVVTTYLRVTDKLARNFQLQELKSKEMSHQMD